MLLHKLWLDFFSSLHRGDAQAKKINVNFTEFEQDYYVGKFTIHVSIAFDLLVILLSVPSGVLYINFNKGNDVFPHTAAATAEGDFSR
jgi:uncharacterized membrane protein